MYLIALGVVFLVMGVEIITPLFVALTSFGMVVVTGGTGLQALRGMEAYWRSLRIEVGEDYVARAQSITPSSRMKRADITRIEESRFGLLVRTENRWRTLIIPAGLDAADYQAIRSTLATWMPIQPRAPINWARIAAIVIPMVISFGVILISTSVWLVLIVGLGLMITFGAFLWRRLREKGTPWPIIRTGISAFLFVVVVTIVKIIDLNGLNLILRPFGIH
ncbi:MAG: hypothetical protein ABIV92_10835 [Thermoflexales bacterium]